MRTAADRGAVYHPGIVPGGSGQGAPMTYYWIMPDRGGYVICTTRSGNKGNPEPIPGTPLYVNKAEAVYCAQQLAIERGGEFVGCG